jgi:hypothetical protein
MAPYDTLEQEQECCPLVRGEPKSCGMGGPQQTNNPTAREGGHPINGQETTGVQLLVCHP